MDRGRKRRGHGLLRGRPGGGGGGRQLVDAIEARRQLLGALLGQSFPATAPVAVYDFADAAAAASFGIHSETRQLVQGATVTAVAFGPLAGRRAEIERAVAGQLVAENLGLLPVFWRSGFAELLAEVELGPAGVRPLAPAAALELLRAEDWLSLSQFSEVDLDRHQPATRRRLAAQVWALLYHDAVVQPKKRERLQRFVGQMLAGETATTAFMAAYGTYYDEIQLDVRRRRRRSGAKSFENASAFSRSPCRQSPSGGFPRPGATPGSVCCWSTSSRRRGRRRCAAARSAKPLGRPKSARALGAARLLEQSGELEAARLYDQAAAAAPEDGEIAYFAGAAWLRPAPEDKAADPAAALAHLRRAREGGRRSARPGPMPRSPPTTRNRGRPMPSSSPKTRAGGSPAAPTPAWPSPALPAGRPGGRCRAAGRRRPDVAPPGARRPAGRAAPGLPHRPARAANRKRPPGLIQGDYEGRST